MLDRTIYCTYETYIHVYVHSYVHVKNITLNTLNMLLGWPYLLLNISFFKIYTLQTCRTQWIFTEHLLYSEDFESICMRIFIMVFSVELENWKQSGYVSIIEVVDRIYNNSTSWICRSLKQQMRYTQRKMYGS